MPNRNAIRFSEIHTIRDAEDECAIEALHQPVEELLRCGMPVLHAVETCDDVETSGRALTARSPSARRAS